MRSNVMAVAILAVFVLFGLAAKQVNNVGSTRMKVIICPLGTTYATADSLPGWSKITEVGYKSSVGITDSTFVHLSSGWTGIRLSQFVSGSFTIRSDNMSEIKDAADKPDTLAAYVNSGGPTPVVAMYLWGD